jgi:DegV family protein with EDD domain
MPNIAIITDSTAQFANPIFHGNDLIQVIPSSILFNDRNYTDRDEEKIPKVNNFPLIPFNKSDPQLVMPGVTELAKLFVQLLKTYNELIVLSSSTYITNIYQNSVEAVELIKGKSAIRVIDSQTVSVGLGHIVQIAAEKIAAGASSTDAEREIRQLIPHIYTLFCSPGLRYLSNIGLINYSQAVIGEILSMHPIYSLEDGIPKPLCKTKNFRNTQEYFQEFIEEYDSLKIIALIKGVGINGFDNRTMKQYVQEIHPHTPFSEHRLNPNLAALFGPKTLGLIVIEKPYSLNG